MKGITMALRKESQELFLFRQFASESGSDFNLETAKNGCPPQPDILCCSGDGTDVGIELVSVSQPDLCEVVGRHTSRKFQSTLPGVSYTRLQVFPNSKAVCAKFEKDYEVKGILELLIYTNDYLVSPYSLWGYLLGELVQDLAPQSKFRRVWMWNRDSSDPFTRVLWERN